MLVGLIYGAKRLWDDYIAPGRRPSARPAATDAFGRIGFDTPTGTDPNAKYAQPGFEEKSFGQAVSQDQELVDDLMAASHGDEAAAEETFRHVSAGAPALDRQSRRDE